MRIPKSQSHKYNLIGRHIEYKEDDSDDIIPAKVAGFTSDAVIVVTYDDLVGSEIDPDNIVTGWYR